MIRDKLQETIERNLQTAAWYDEDGSMYRPTTSPGQLSFLYETYEHNPHDSIIWVLCVDFPRNNLVYVAANRIGREDV